MASPYFSGSSPASFLPQGYMEAATAPGRNMAAGISQLGKGIGRRIEKARERKKDDEYFDFIERMGKTPKERDQTFSVPELVARNRPRTDEAAGDYFNDQLAARDSYQRQLDWLSGLEKEENATNRVKAYAADELPENHPIHAIIAEGDRMMEDANQASAEETAAQFNDMVLQSIQSRTQRPDQTQREGGARIPDPFEEMMGFEEGQRTKQILEDVYKDSLPWVKEYQLGIKGMMADREKNLDDFMAGKDEKGKSLMDLQSKEVKGKTPMSIKERRDIVMNDLSGLGRKLGKERYKEARTEVDKLFPRSPEIETVKRDGVTIITEDGKYKLAMATPTVKGNSMFEQLPDAVQKLVPGMQDDVRKDPTVKGYIAGYVAYNKMRSAAELGTGAGDMALLTGFLKALDPESVVRESEMAAASRTTSAANTISAFITNIIDGTTLTPQHRQEVLVAAQKLVAINLEDANFVLADFREVAIASGIPGATADKLILPNMLGAASGGEGESESPTLSFNPATGEWEGLQDDAGN
jgi:hypothetical protein